MTRPAYLLFAVVAFPAVGCGSSHLDSRDAARDTGVDGHRSPDAARDGGPDGPSDAARDATSDAARDATSDAARDATSDAARDATVDAVVLTGRHAFDVTAKLAVTPSQSGGSSSFPTTAHATLVLDATAGWLLIGAGGQGSSTATTASGGTVSIATPVSLAVPFSGACDGQATLRFATLAVTVDGDGRLHGAGSGLASYIVGDVGYSQAFTATLDGLPDATPPSLPIDTAGVLDPLAPARFAVSEPLPPSSKAHLVGADGSLVDLWPEVPSDASPAFITAFRVPFALAYGASYQVVVDQMVDFAGNQALPPKTALSTLTAPALLTDGGFETTTGLDASLISSGGDLPVISGTKSFYLNASVWQGSTVSFRLAVHPGDKVVHFSYRVTSTYPSGSFYGAIVIGSAGAPVASLATLPLGTPTTTVTRSDGSTLTIGPVSTLELTLPDATASEVVLKISTALSGCGLPPPRAGLIIDELSAGG